MYINGSGSIKAIILLYKNQTKRLYKAIYPKHTIKIRIMEPNNPNTIPSIINGVIIVKLLAPTNLIIDISLFLEKIVNLIVLIIKNTVTRTKAITIPYDTF